MIWMQKIALIFSFLLLLAQSYVRAQSLYNHRLILTSSSTSEKINPCYYPVAVDTADNGTLIFVNNGGKYDIKYKPDSLFLGNDTVTIMYEDLLAGGKILYKSFIYETVTSSLTAVNDYITVYKNQVDVEVKPLLNDLTSLNQLDKIKIKNLPAFNNIQSNVSIQSDSIVKFTPVADFEGAASITYRVCDTFGLCKEAIINISVVDSNTLKLNDTIWIQTPEDQGLQILLPYTGFVIDDDANHGKVKIVDASMTYNPYLNYNGSDNFIVKKGNIKRWVNVTVIPMPEANSIIIDDVVFTPLDKEIFFDVSENDLQSVVYNYVIGIGTGVNKGTLTKINNQGLFKYKPQAGYSGVQSFTYKVCPQGICEYAKVTIFIGDYEPQVENVYNINTYKNLPVLLSYKVPVKTYDFSSTADTTLKYYPGWDTIVVNAENGCSYTFSGYNQLIYIPLKNTIYSDTFSINYCIDSTNNCITASMKMTVDNESGDCIKQCAGDCVWPGDIDQNGQVDMLDLLALGNELGKTGPVRPYIGTTFRSHNADNWGELLANSSVDIKNADCNGDSTVNASDTSAIFNSYGKRHSLVPNDVYAKGDFPIYFNLVDTALEIGDIGMIEVQLGDDNDKAINVTGYSYILDYNENAIIDSTLYVNYYEQGWFGRSATLLNMFKKPNEGRLESGFVRANAAQVSGKGPVEVMVYIVEDDIMPYSKDEGIYSFNFNNIIYQGADGLKYKLDDQTINLKKKRITDKEAPIELEDKKLIVYPNPATEYTMIHLNGRNTISSYELYSIDGRFLIDNKNPNPKQNVLSTSGLANGIYLLRVHTPVGLITRKIEIMN